jgi:hypothetical protein
VRRVVNSSTHDEMRNAYRILVGKPLKPKTEREREREREENVWVGLV